MHSFLGAPIQIDGEPAGNIYFAEKLGPPFTAEDERAAIGLATGAAAMIASTRPPRSVQDVLPRCGRER